MHHQRFLIQRLGREQFYDLRPSMETTFSGKKLLHHRMALYSCVVLSYSESNESNSPGFNFNVGRFYAKSIKSLYNMIEFILF